jgi:Ca-activated chloride channel family protein
MSWQHPFVFLLLPAAAAGAWWLFRGRPAAAGERLPNVARRWADRLGLHAAAPVMAERGRGIALGLAAVLALLALARPQWGEIPEQTVSHAREVMIALDLSQSMLADDVSPNRLARAKLLVDALLDALHGERVGLTVFAGTAFVQSPLSADYEVLREFLAALDTSYLPQGGTDYAAMLRAARDAFGTQGGGDRYLVVLSDGEAHDEEWQQLVPTLRARGIRVIGLGVGTPQGALVPAPDGGVLKDESGNAVLSRLEPATLQELAAQTGGTYRDAATWVDIADLVGTTVATGRSGDYVEERRSRREDRFQWFLAPALLLFLLSYWREFPLAPLARALPTRGRRPLRASAPAIAAALIGLVAWQPPRQALAVAADAPPPRSAATVSPAPDLSATIAELSAKPVLDAPDYARLATDTIGFASQASSPRGAARDGIIDDALVAVGRGEQRAPHAADWPALRQQLEALRTPPEPPPSESQQNQASQQNQGAQQNQGSQQNPDQQASQDQQAQPGKNDQPQQNQQGGGGSTTDQAQQPNAGGGEAQAREARSAQGGDAPPQPLHGHPEQQARSDDQKDAQGPEPSARGEAPEQKRGDAQQPGEVAQQQDPKPLESAGLGDGEKDAPAAPQPEKETEAKDASTPPQGTRLVGGGPATAEAPQSSDPATADLLARMEHVKDGDAPAVLFDRMNRADGQPRPTHDGKNW